MNYNILNDAEQWKKLRFAIKLYWAKIKSLKKNQECDGNNLVMKIRKLFINSIWITEKAVEIHNINIAKYKIKW